MCKDIKMLLANEVKIFHPCLKLILEAGEVFFRCQFPWPCPARAHSRGGTVLAPAGAAVLLVRSELGFNFSLNVSLPAPAQSSVPISLERSPSLGWPVLPWGCLQCPQLSPQPCPPLGSSRTWSSQGWVSPPLWGACAVSRAQKHNRQSIYPTFDNCFISP